MTEPNFADGVARMNPLYFTAARENQDRILPAVSAAGLGTGSKGCSGCGPGSSGAWVGNPLGRSAAVSDGLNVVSVANWAAALGEGSGLGGICGGCFICSTVGPRGVRSATGTRH